MELIDISGKLLKIFMNMFWCFWSSTKCSNCFVYQPVPVWKDFQFSIQILVKVLLFYFCFQLLTTNIFAYNSRVIRIWNVHFFLPLFSLLSGTCSNIPFLYYLCYNILFLVLYNKRKKFWLNNKLIWLIHLFPAYTRNPSYLYTHPSSFIFFAYFIRSFWPYVLFALYSRPFSLFSYVIH